MLKTSPWAKPVLKRALELEQKSSLASDLLDEWIQFQRSWIYLENIFSQKDI